jgi:hypothetical protein
MSPARRAESIEAEVRLLDIQSHGIYIPLTYCSGNRFEYIDETRLLTGVSQLWLDETLLNWDEVRFL